MKNFTCFLSLSMFLSLSLSAQIDSTQHRPNEGEDLIYKYIEDAERKRRSNLVDIPRDFTVLIRSGLIAVISNDCGDPGVGKEAIFLPFSHYIQHREAHLAGKEHEEVAELYQTSYMGVMLAAKDSILASWELEKETDTMNGLVIQLPFYNHWTIHQMSDGVFRSYTYNLYGECIEVYTSSFENALSNVFWFHTARMTIKLFNNRHGTDFRDEN